MNSYEIELFHIVQVIFSTYGFTNPSPDEVQHYFLLLQDKLTEISANAGRPGSRRACEMVKGFEKLHLDVIPKKKAFSNLAFRNMADINQGFALLGLHHSFFVPKSFQNMFPKGVPVLLLHKNYVMNERMQQMLAYTLGYAPRPEVGYPKDVSAKDAAETIKSLLMKNWQL